MSKQILNTILSVCLFDKFKKKSSNKNVSSTGEKLVLHALYLDVGLKKELLMESTEEDMGSYIKFINNKEEFTKKILPLVEKYGLDEVLIKDLIILDLFGGVYKISYLSDDRFLTEKIGFIPNGYEAGVRQNFLNSPTDYSKLVDKIEGIDEIIDEVNDFNSVSSSSLNNVSKNGNFKNLSLENYGNDYLFIGSFTITFPITQLAILIGVNNEIEDNMRPVVLNNFQVTERTLDFAIPITKAINNFRYLLLLVVSDSDDKLSFETLNEYNIEEIVFVPIKDIM